MIAKNPALASRRSTDLRDRFRNAFPDLYEKAGYKPRPTRPIKKRREDEGGSSSVLQVPSTLSRANSRSNRNAREGSEGRSGSDNPTESSAHRHHRQGEGMSVETTCADTPEGDQAFEDNRCIVVTDAQKDSSMDTDGCYDDARGVRPAMVPIPSSSSDGSAVPSRQRSPSNAQSNNPNEGNEYLSPGEAAHTHLRESPAHQNQQHIPLQQPQFDGGRYADGWYSARWLQGSNDHEEQSPHNNHGQQVPMLMTEFNSSQGLGLNNVHGMNSNNLNAGNLGMLGLGLGNLSAGGWSNQQTIIDRYDLPSSSQQFLLHSGEFQSEAAIGDTGSSISGLDEFGTNLSTSSHHRYIIRLYLLLGRNIDTLLDMLAIYSMEEAPDTGAGGVLLASCSVALIKKACLHSLVLVSTLALLVCPMLFVRPTQTPTLSVCMGGWALWACPRLISEAQPNRQSMAKYSVQRYLLIRSRNLDTCSAIQYSAVRIR